MASAKVFDYVICSFGVLGALYIGGAFGRVLGFLRIIIFFISTTVVIYAATGIVLTRFSGLRSGDERNLYLLHAITNSLPIIVQLLF